MGIDERIIKAYQSHADAIYKFCYYRVYNKEIAEDLTQETFLRLFEYLREGKEIEHIRGFLYRTARNIVVDHSRKQKDISLEGIQEIGFDPAEKLPTFGLDQEWLIGVVKQIKKDYSEPLLMRYVEDMKPREIARALGKPSSEISTKIYHGLKKLKKLLADGGLHEV